MTEGSVYLEIVDLMNRYSRVVGDGDIDAWPALFADDDPVYQVTTFENFERGLPLSLILDDSRGKIEDRVIMVRDIWTGNFERHRLRHLVAITSVEPQDDGALEVRSNVVVYRTGPDGRSELFVVGEARDRLVPGDQGLRFKTRCVVLDTNVLPYSLVYPI